MQNKKMKIMKMILIMNFFFLK